MRRVGSLIVCLLLLLAFPHPAAAQHSTEDEQHAIDAVTSFLLEMGETNSADIWIDGWTRGIYTFNRLPGPVWAEAQPGSDHIQFNQNMLMQLDRRTADNPVHDWAAAFHHELVHTKQGRSGHVGSYWSHKAGAGDFHEATGWGRTLESYWGWLRLANSRYAKARTEDERQRLAEQVVALSKSFQDCFKNYTAEDLGPLPKWVEFPPLGGTDSTPLTIKEALSEAARVNKSVGDNLRLTVQLNRASYTLEPGQEFSLTAHAKNSWNRPSYTWKSGSKVLAEKGATLTRKATVDETITVTVQDNRNQKASASCEVTVKTPVVKAGAPTPATPKTPVTKPLEKTPAKGEYAWVQVDKRINDWKKQLDSRNKSMNGFWTHKMSVSEGSVTITNTFTGAKSSSWPKNGMSNTGTATWTPPRTTIRSGDVVPVGLTVVNAPRDHVNFGPVILIKVEAYRLGKDGKFTGSSSYFADEKGEDSLGDSSQTKAPQALTVSRKFGAGGAEGDKMAIRVTAQGETEKVQTEYIYEWRKF